MVVLISVVYMIIMIVGVMLPLAIVLRINKKNNYINTKQLIFFECIFMLFFIFFAKVFHVILDKNLESISQIFKEGIRYIVNFIVSGYTFIGGYIGGLFATYIMYKKFKADKIICICFVNSLNLMYAIHKIACFINGCCYGFTWISVQLLESLICFTIYVGITILYSKRKNINNCMGLSIILFSTQRFVISFYRAYMTDLGFWGNELICMILIIIGIAITLKNEGKR